MSRYIIATGIFLSLLAVRAQAATDSGYAVATEASQTGNKITVSVKLGHKDLMEVPNVGKQEVTTTLSNPSVGLAEGKEATMVISSKAVANAKPGEIASGYKVNVISVKGRGEVLVVTTVIEAGTIVWADVATVHIVVAKAASGS